LYSFGQRNFACQMALNVCPLDYLISRTGNVILFLLLHNAQSGRVSALGENSWPRGKSPNPTHPPFPQKYTPVWQFLDCSHVRGSWWCCSGLFACNSVKSCACIQVIPPAQAFDMKNAFYWDYFYNVSDLRVPAAIKSVVIKAFRVCVQNANSINFTFMLSSLPTPFIIQICSQFSHFIIQFLNFVDKNIKCRPLCFVARSLLMANYVLGFQVGVYIYTVYIWTHIVCPFWHMSMAVSISR